MALRTNNVKENNKLRVEDESIHSWYRFVLSFPPHLVREYTSRFGLDGAQTVLDPFCGTGTTLVECKKLGVNCVGIEANPLLHFASSTKLATNVSPSGLAKHAACIAREATNRLEELGTPDYDSPLLSGQTQANVGTSGFRSLSDVSQKLLLSESISPLPLHKALVLLESIQRHADRLYLAHEKLAFARSLVADSSNLHFGPEVGVRRQKTTDCPVVASWLRAVNEMVRDLEAIPPGPQPQARAILGDSRDVGSILNPCSVDAIITSPPYPNEKDYTRTTRLESVLLGFVQDKMELRRVKQSLVRSNTRSVYKADEDDALVEDHLEINRIADSIERRRKQLGKTSGFERLYARLTKLYFGGMLRHFLGLQTVLKPGARLAYVVGDQASYLRVMIRTGQILADLAQSIGYQVEDIELFRTRLSTATREQLREEVVILRWPGKGKQ